MALNRSLIRNVWFHEARNPEKILGGLYQNGSITEENFLDILRIVLDTEENPLRVEKRGSGHILYATDTPLKEGVYDIYCDVAIKMNNEPWIPRSISNHTTHLPDTRFCPEVRNRDRKCVVSGLTNPEVHVKANYWCAFERAHIFPPEHEDLWTMGDYGRYITDIHDSFGTAKIDSCQNGFLLTTGAHQAFQQYLVSVNPDDNYKIVVFDIDIFGWDGRILDPVCRNPEDPHRISDELLRWHFRQSILANARGAGEPIFEHDFPPGHDMVGEILAGPYGQERFKLEIASRLRGFHKDNNFGQRETLQLSV